MKAKGREIAVVGGAWRERRLDSAGRHVSGRIRAAKGELYVFVQAEGPDAEAWEPEVFERVAQVYYHDPARSVTTSLTHALAAANDDLYAANEPAAPDERTYAATLCLVLRDGDAYFAQAGPTTAYLVVPEGVQRLGREIPAAGADRGLGSFPDLDAELFYQTVDRECSIVLGHAALADVAAPTALRQLLVLSDDLDVGAALQALVRASDEPPDLYLHVVQVDRPPRRPRHLIEDSLPTDDVAPGYADTAEPGPEGEDGGLTATGVAVEEPPGDPAAGEEAPVEAVVRPGDRIVRGLERVRDRIRRATSAPRRLRRRLLIGTMVALAVFAALVVPLRLWQDRQAGITDLDLLARAEEVEREALAAQDSGQRLRLLLEADELAGRAERAARLRRGDSAVEAARRRIQGELDALTGAVRLKEPALTLALEGQPTQLVLGGASLYVLDQAVARVYRYPLTSDGLNVQAAANPGVFRKGDRYGDVVARAPARLLWMPAGGARSTDALLVLDEAGALFEIDLARGVRALRSPAPWAPTQVLAGYAGSLFVLDPLAGTLEWRRPTPDGYDGAAYPYFQPGVVGSLADGAALAVDGDVYLLRTSGRIDRFALGSPQPFPGGVPDRPLGQPASLVATPRSLFVLDQPNRRAVQFSREGIYQRQYVFDGPGDPLGLAVDEPRGLLYLLGRQGVYLYRLAQPLP